MSITSSFKFFGKKYTASKKMALPIALVAIAFAIVFIWAVIGGLWNFGEAYLDSGWISVITLLLFTTSIKINSINYTLIPESKPKKVISLIIFWSAFFYYFYTVCTT